MVGWARAAVLDTTVDLPETADTDGLAHVDVAGNGGGADVEPCSRGVNMATNSMNGGKILPVLALRRKLLCVGGLDSVGPTCRLVSAKCSDTHVPRSTRDSGFSIFNMYVYVCSFHLFFWWCSRTWNWQLSLTLQEGSVGVDELVRRDITNGDSRHIGGIGGVEGVVVSIVEVRLLELEEVANEISMCVQMALGCTFRRFRNSNGACAVDLASRHSFPLSLTFIDITTARLGSSPG